MNYEIKVHQNNFLRPLSPLLEINQMTKFRENRENRWRALRDRQYLFVLTVNRYNHEDLCIKAAIWYLQKSMSFVRYTHEFDATVIVITEFDCL